MRRLVLALFIAVLFFSLIACGNSQSDTIVCANCDSEISDSSNFCSICGVAIEPNGKEVTVSVTEDFEQIDTDNYEQDIFSDMDNQLHSIVEIFKLSKDDDILSIFPNSHLLENGNIVVDGAFSEVTGFYEIYCWNNQAYQIVFRWDESESITPTNIVSDVNSCMGEYINHNEYWDIYEWENDTIEISFETEEGIWIEPILGNTFSVDSVTTVSTIPAGDDLPTMPEDVANEILVIKDMMSFIDKPKAQAFAHYTTLVDDDWNQLLMPGNLFGIDGHLVFMYHRDTGIIYSIAFDWVPDNMESHEAHIVNYLNLYFGECPDVHNTEFNDEIYYYHDWDATTDENWSVHLSMTVESGWLQFSQLVVEEAESENFSCIECGKDATNIYTNPFSGQDEHYCYSHYKEIIDTLGDMEEDVGSSDYSKQTCMECDREGTHRYDSSTGQTEYYCTIHYEELMDMLEELGFE